MTKTKTNEFNESEPVIEKNEVVKETDFYQEIKKYEDKGTNPNLIGIIIAIIAIIISAILFML